MDISQSASFIHSMTYDSGINDYASFPKTENPVWVMGQQYSVLYDLDDIKSDIVSRLWFTYRKGFAAIGGSGPCMDTGWGCMLRCGQMILAQALIHRHLGRGWRWKPDKYEPKYFEVLRQFLDKKDSCYSIHQIASMGAMEGKSVGNWFGPNTVSQVLRKLAYYDKWSDMAIHVSMDNTVVIDDIYYQCRFSSKTAVNCPTRSAPTQTATHSQSDPCSSASAVNGVTDRRFQPTAEEASGGGAQAGDGVAWKPLLLLIPLRLGLSDINTTYLASLKNVGVIGGKPNHAYYFVGFVDDELIYLDPHTTQAAADVTAPGASDETYHCPYACRMPADQIDPSIAIGFYCGSEEDFVDLLERIRRQMRDHKLHMFELSQHRPTHWPPFEIYSPGSSLDNPESDLFDRHYDTDEEYEIL